MTETLLIPASEMQNIFTGILLQNGFPEEKAIRCAEVFTSNSIDGVYTHGVNRFPRFVHYVKQGFVKPQASPLLTRAFGGIEQWDGALGAGPLNALHATERAMQLSREHGIGCVGLANTNHWMRGGTYGWKAAKEGFVFIGWTNTMANMPAWNAIDPRLGNNPLVMALPYGDEAIVLDMAMSQFSFGALEQSAMKKEELPVWGGYDKDGHLSKVPADIMDSGRTLPIGYWKGAGLSLLLDILATTLSGGLSTHQISKKEAEYGLSQVFIAIDIRKLHHHSAIGMMIEKIVEDYHQSQPDSNGKNVTYPGEGVLRRRKENLANGIPVLKEIWEQVGRL